MAAVEQKGITRALTADDAAVVFVVIIIVIMTVIYRTGGGHTGSGLFSSSDGQSQGKRQVTNRAPGTRFVLGVITRLVNWGLGFSVRV